MITFRLRNNYVIILSLNASKPFLARNVSGGQNNLLGRFCSSNESMKETIPIWQWEKDCCLMLSIHLSHHKRAIDEFDWFRTLWLNDNTIRANPPIWIVSIENRSNYPFLIRCIFDHNSFWIFWSDNTVEDRGLLFTAIYFWKRAASQRTKNDFIPELGSRRWNWKFREKHFWNPNPELLLHSSYSFWP